MASNTVSGLASSIRRATDSESFDLAGQNQSSITSSINDAFATPFSLQHMIRLTFVTGAGKLGRQKYDDGAAKAVTSTLRNLGYEEDRGASCVVECAGSFKLQHDTGKNLKTVVVFPEISPIDTEDMEKQASHLNIADGKKVSSLIPPGTPEHMCALSSSPVFSKMFLSKCPSWSQKKGCLAALQSIQNILNNLEAQLGRGEALEDADQDLFDSISFDSLAKKEAMVKKEMQAQVEAEILTKFEKETLKSQVTEKIATLEKEIKESEKKPKKIEKLNTMLGKSQTRLAKLEEIIPKAPHRLKHDPEIIKLRVEMLPLQKIEDAVKGRLCTMKETMAISKKEEILDEINEYEKKSRGWFESDEAFQARVEASQRVSKATAKQKSTKKTASKTSSMNNSVYKKPATNWVTPGMKTQKKAPAKKKAQGGSVFSMMMMDSDSD